MIYDPYWWEDEKYECDICKRFLSTPEEVQRQICNDCWEENNNPYDEYLKYGVAPGDKKEDE